jgi:hypothetical protein
MLISGSSILASLATSTLNKINQTTASATTKAADATSASDGAAAPQKSAKDDFLDYAKMTPAQKMRAAMLGKMGLTEEQLKAMDPKERQKIEDKLKAQIKEQVMNDPKMKQGALVDIQA